MIEYPSIINSSKAPRKAMVAFEKYDGSNIRVKYTTKQGFSLFGSRHELIDRSNEFLGEAIDIFRNDFENILVSIFKKHFSTERELIVFGEFFGSQSFAGQHEDNDPKQIVLFDILVGHKNRHFLLPTDFIRIFSNEVNTAKVIYQGNLTDGFITDVRKGVYQVNEGVVCKGLDRTGAFSGNVWMCKIKTYAYLNRLRERYGEDGIKKYGE